MAFKGQLRKPGEVIKSQEWNKMLKEIERLGKAYDELKQQVVQNGAGAKGGEAAKGGAAKDGEFLKLTGGELTGKLTVKDELRVEKNTTIEGGLNVGHSGDNAFIRFTANNDKKGSIGVQDDNDQGFYVHVGGKYRMSVNKDGNVGIGVNRAKAKLHVAGDLRVDKGILGAATGAKGEALRVCAGSTAAGQGWVNYGKKGVLINVDTSGCGFEQTPFYVASLHGRSSHWSTTGGSSIYLPKPTGFRIYVRWSNQNPLSPADAKKLGWHIQWVAVGK